MCQFDVRRADPSTLVKERWFSGWMFFSSAAAANVRCAKELIFTQSLNLSYLLVGPSDHTVLIREMYAMFIFITMIVTDLDNKCTQFSTKCCSLFHRYKANKVKSPTFVNASPKIPSRSIQFFITVPQNCTGTV